MSDMAQFIDPKTLAVDEIALSEEVKRFRSLNKMSVYRSKHNGALYLLDPGSIDMVQAPHYDKVDHLFE